MRPATLVGENGFVTNPMARPHASVKHDDMSIAHRLRWLLLLLAVPAFAQHKAIHLKGLHAYADDESVAAGDVNRFHVSSEVPYRLRITKLGLEVDDRASDETIHLSKETYPAKVQPIRRIRSAQGSGAWPRATVGFR